MCRNYVQMIFQVYSHLKDIKVHNYSICLLYVVDIRILTAIQISKLTGSSQIIDNFGSESNKLLFNRFVIYGTS